MLYSLEDTIVALSTPLGRSGLGVVRLSGPRSLETVEKLFTPAGNKTLSSAPSHVLIHGWLSDGERAIDEVMVGLMRGPHSYTGEDVVEISAHGGPVLLRRIVHACLSCGARPAGPGEFTFRAFINGRMDLSRAEAVADLIESKTERAAEAALQQLKGALSKKTAAFRQGLLDLLSHLEVALDHAEEDIPFLSKEEILRRLSGLKDDVAGLRASASRGKMLREGVKVAIIGKPNAGKSSLLNALLERERAIVTDIPGTTRDVIEETLDCRGIPLVVMDTAGLREHCQDPVEKIGQERTREAIRAADLVLWLLDASAPLAEADRLIGRLVGALNKEQKLVVAWNKVDQKPLLSEDEAKALCPADAPRVRISALNRDGLSGLEDAILRCLDAGGAPASEPFLINERHCNALEKTGAALSEALAAVNAGSSEEFIAFHVREALDALGEITGETATDEILRTIFSRFCLGK
ncbi:MAG: tRNA uridine-5-carboxymethylaminomethyl(34) synthesis GTPase MnmE [Endomicrobiales bacterium]